MTVPAPTGASLSRLSASPTDVVRRVTVVVPARNEELLIGRCLVALEVARRRLRRRRPEVAVEVIVVLDACTDDTADVVARHPGVTALPIHAARVGAARQAGIRVLVERSGAGAVPDLRDRGSHWVTTTDADSIVPVSWLLDQLLLAEAGNDVVVGVVEPDASELDAEVLARWRARHRLVDGHDHVHGANLAFRLSTYVAAGGFEPLAAHEDVRLVQRMRATGARVAASARVRVRTSARTTGRAPRGFAAYLDDLTKLAPAVEAG